MTPAHVAAQLDAETLAMLEIAERLRANEPALDLGDDRMITAGSLNVYRMLARVPVSVVLAAIDMTARAVAAAEVFAGRLPAALRWAWLTSAVESAAAAVAPSAQAQGEAHTP